MKEGKTFRKRWVVITLFALFCLPSLQYFDQLIFFNKTLSMPRGVYVKYSSNNLNKGDIIVFSLKEKKLNLLKYIAGYEGDVYCMDFQGTLWINDIPSAQQNIIKYYDKLPNHSVCQRLKKDDLLVLGEHPDSYDSRYFGPIKTQQVVAQVELALEWKND